MTEFRKKALEPKIERHAENQFHLHIKFQKPKSSVLSTLSKARRASRILTKTPKSAASKGRGGVSRQRFNSQRVIVKASVVKSKPGQGAKKLKAHVNYLARSGVGREGQEVRFALSDRELGSKELKKELSNWNDDPHHFRFIISPERASEIDLDHYAKSIVSRMSKDLGTKLEWFSVAHYNTDNSHLHLVVRGRDEEGKPLFINRDYIKHGLRQQAQLEATVRLGKEPPNAYRIKLIEEVKKLKLTSIDKRLKDLEQQSESRLVRLIVPGSESREVTKLYFEANIKRLHYLRDLELAEELNPGVWKLKKGFDKSLYTLGVKKEIEKRLENKLPTRQHLLIHDEYSQLDYKIIGIVLDRGLHDEFKDNAYLLVSADDGATHYQVLSKYSEPEGFGAGIGQVVEIEPSRKENLTDKTILRFTRNNYFDLVEFSAAVNNQRQLGKWNIAKEMSTEQYVSRYKERLENLLESGIVKKINNNRFEIPSDLETQVNKLESSLGKKQHVRVKSLNPHSLDKQILAEGKTWLDELIVNKSKVFKSGTLFSAQVNKAIKERKSYLIAKGYQIGIELLDKLHREELLKLIQSLSSKYGHYTSDFGTQTWTVKEYKTLSNAQYAVLTSGSKFTLYKANEKKPLGSTITNPLSIKRKL